MTGEEGPKMSKNRNRDKVEAQFPDSKFPPKGKKKKGKNKYRGK